MDSILKGSPTEISPRKRAHSSTTTDSSPISTNEPLKKQLKQCDDERKSPSPAYELPVKKKPKLIEDTTSSSTNNNDRPKSPIKESKEIEAPKPKEIAKQEIDPLASLAAFDRPSTSSSSSLVSLDDIDELEKRLVLLKFLLDVN